jgi:hypothetical protein
MVGRIHSPPCRVPPYPTDEPERLQQRFSIPVEIDAHAGFSGRANRLEGDQIIARSHLTECPIGQPRLEL